MSELVTTVQYQRKSILNPTFKYVPAAATDIRKTFARLKREQKARSKTFQVVQIRRVG